MPCTRAPPKPIAFRHFMARVVCAVPRKFVSGSLVQGMAERRCVYAHLSCDVVPPAKLVGTAVALEDEHEVSTPRSASAVRNLTFASGSPSITKPIACSWKHSTSTVLAPMASHHESITSAVLTRSLCPSHDSSHESREGTSKQMDKQTLDLACSRSATKVGPFAAVCLSREQHPLQLGPPSSHCVWAALPIRCSGPKSAICLADQRAHSRARARRLLTSVSFSSCGHRTLTSIQS